MAPDYENCIDFYQDLVDMRHVKVSPILTNLDGWVVPRDIVEPKIICKYENDVGLSVELGPPLLLREAGVAQCHQEGDQHSSSQIILLQEIFV